MKKAGLATLAAIAAFAAVVGIATILLRGEYRSPIAKPAAVAAPAETTPRDQGEMLRKPWPASSSRMDGVATINRPDGLWNQRM